MLAGIDVLAAENFARLRGKRVGLLTNQTGRSRDGESTIDLLARAPGVTLVALFSPEHGIRGELDEKVDSSRDEKTGLPIHSLYGETRRPTAAMLDGLDVVVVDLQDVGARFYTYPATIAYVLEEAAKRKLPVVVLDRPNPIDGFDVEGPAQDAGGNRLRRLPADADSPRPDDRRAGAAVQRRGQHRRRPDRRADEELAARRLVRRDRPAVGEPVAEHAQHGGGDACIPGIGAIEGTNVSVGRGTDTPFEQLGAPWIDGPALAAALNASALPGVRFYPVTFTPAAGAKLGGQVCHGVFLIVTDRDRLRPVRVGLEIASTLSRLYGAAVHAGRRRDAVRAEGDAREDSRRRGSGGDRRVVGGRRSGVAPDAREVSAVLNRVIE